MRADGARLLLVATVVLLGVTGCGGDERPFRIGVLNDCVGIFRGLDDAQLSGAQMPLIERGARLLGTRPTDGISRPRVAGRPVELVRACSETLEFSTIFQEVRRLVDREGVDAVVAGTLGVDAVALRQVARLYPDVPFVAAPTGAREATLRDRPANLFRVAPDHGQTVAGLATYAFRTLGWRDATVVAHNWDIGWGETAAFVAEFCALGGSVDQLRLDYLDPSGSDADRVPTNADGVAVLTNGILGTQAPFVRRLAQRVGEPSRRVVLGPYVTSDQDVLRRDGNVLRGVAGSSLYPPPGAREMQAHLRLYRQVYPGLAGDLAGSELVIAYRDAVEALLQAFERARGSLADGRRQLREQLATLRADLGGRPVRMDANGQDVTTATLVRIVPGESAGSSRVVALRSIPSVDQSVGGLLAPALRPSSVDAPCRRQAPPPWSR